VLVLIEIIVKALAYSSCIALGASSITIIYMATRTFNFTHASLIAWGFYVVFSLYSILGGSPYLYLVFAALFSGFLGVLIYLTVNRRLLRARSSEVVLMMSTLGLDLILFAFINIYADFLTAVYGLHARYFVLELKDLTIDIGMFSIRAIGVIAPVIMVLIVIALNIFLTKTKFGIAMRASIENPSLAGMIGINPELIYMSSWLIGGLLAGLSGGLLSMVISGYPAVGMTTIVSFFAGSIVGGLYSIFGSLLGGLLIGLSEYMGIYFLSMVFGGEILAYRPIIPLIIMAITLLIYPKGLAGISLYKFKTFVWRGGGK
jgi:branched-chain amino acid transport system permease protein